MEATETCVNYYNNVRNEFRTIKRN